ncbi:hypothetical protein D3C75_1298340 [compost metagenome]
MAMRRVSTADAKPIVVKFGSSRKPMVLTGCGTLAESWAALVPFNVLAMFFPLLHR